ERDHVGEAGDGGGAHLVIGRVVDGDAVPAIAEPRYRVRTARVGADSVRGNDVVRKRRRRIGGGGPGQRDSVAAVGGDQIPGVGVADLVGADGGEDAAA